MIPTPSRRPASALRFAFGFFFAGLIPASAQTVFVCLGGKAKMASVISIPAPGHGWSYSAVAPVPGEHWNRLRRTAGVDATDPGVAGSPAGATGKLGLHPLDTATDVPLVDPEGRPTNVHLTVQIEVLTLATDKARTEPAIHSKSVGAIPIGLMDAAWRVFLPQNRLHFTLTGLVPGRAYDLYLYGACVDMVSNPDGTGEGARFTLAPANLVPGNSGTVETAGGFCGGIYTFNPEVDRMAPSPAGTTWALLPAVADGQGVLKFSTAQNSNRRHYVNGFQLVDKQP